VQVLLLVQQVQELPVKKQLVLALVQMRQAPELRAQMQPLVLVELHHVVLLKLAHLLKKPQKKMTKSLGYMF
jgi:hypothetical protein